MTSTPPQSPADTPAGGDEARAGRPQEGGGEPFHDGGPRVTREEVRDLGRLRRSSEDRMVAGVAGGLARHLDVDPVLLRVAFVVLAFFGGAGLLVYGACWLLVPGDDGSRPVVSLDERSRTVALVIAGVLAVLALLGDGWGAFEFPWPVALLAAVALVIASRRERRTPPNPGQPYPGQPYPGQPYPGRPYPGQPPAGPGQAGPMASPAGPPPYPPGQPGPSGHAGYQAGYQPGYNPGYQAAYAYAPAPRDPRRRGPRLFWPTVALAALGIGVLGLLDAAGVGVADGAYPALVLGIVGAMLVLGAFFGRAGGLVVLGLLAAFAAGASTVVHQVEAHSVHARPLSAAEVDDRYEVRAGEVVLDLAGVRDPEALLGRTITLEGGVGTLEVIVPDDVPLRTDGEVGIGSVVLFGDDDGGFGVSARGRTGPDGEELRIHAELGIGEIRIRTAPEGTTR